MKYYKLFIYALPVFFLSGCATHMPSIDDLAPTNNNDNSKSYQKNETKTNKTKSLYDYIKSFGDRENKEKMHLRE